MSAAKVSQRWLESTTRRSSVTKRRRESFDSKRSSIDAHGRIRRTLLRHPSRLPRLPRQFCLPMMHPHRTSPSKVRDEVWVRAPALRVSFPNVVELRIELAFDAENGWEPSTQVHVLHPPSRAAFRYPCPFTGCSGSFDLDASLRILLGAGSSGLSASSCCSGVRPFDRSTGKSCGVRLHYRVDVLYERAVTP
jgi:hypothetical protein